MNIEYGKYTDRNDISANGRYIGNVTAQDNNVSDNRQDRMNQLSELKPGDTFTLNQDITLYAIHLPGQ